MPNKKQKFGTPFVMKGSPHKLGTIEGTSAFKAKFAVEQTRTTGDPTLVGAASELGSSYVPGAIDYSIKTGFETKGGEKKKNGEKNGKKKGALEEEIIDTSDLTKKERLQLGESLYPEKESKTKEEKARKKKEEARRKSMSDFSWSEYFKTGELYEQ